MSLWAYVCTYAKYKHTARIDATIPTSSRSHLHVAPWYLLFAIKFLKIFHDTGVYMNRVKDVQSHRWRNDSFHLHGWLVVLPALAGR